MYINHSIKVQHTSTDFFLQQYIAMPKRVVKMWNDSLPAVFYGPLNQMSMDFYRNFMVDWDNFSIISRGNS